MGTLDDAQATQLRNIEAKTGQSLEALGDAVRASGKMKQSEVRSWLMDSFGLGYGDANRLATEALKALTPADPAASAADPLDEIYTGKKAHLRAVHDAVMAALAPLGAFEMAPKKGYVALRRKKQFAMLGPKTNDRAELGINLKAEISSERFVVQKPGGMCQYAVALTRAEDVDAEVVGVLRAAFEAAS